MKTIHLINGYITLLSIDAMINSANKSLLGGSGLDYIVHKKAGPLMKAECIKINAKKVDV